MKYNFQGILVACDTEPRQVDFLSQSPRKRKNSDDRNQAVDFILVDKTGPVCVSAWGAHAEQVCAIWREGIEAQSRGMKKPIVLELCYFRVQNLPKNAWNGELLTRIRFLVSIESCGAHRGTRTEVVAYPTAPGLTAMAFVVPSYQCCVGSFQSFRNKLRAPFRASFKGVIMDVGAMEVSQGGNKKRSFDLVDQQGLFITCCAMKHNAESVALKEVQEVILYFGTGRGPKGSAPGTVHVMKDSLIIAVGKPRPVAPQKKDRVDIQEASIRKHCERAFFSCNAVRLWEQDVSSCGTSVCLRANCRRVEIVRTEVLELTQPVLCRPFWISFWSAVSITSQVFFTDRTGIPF